jgi:AcrR family transcriptional regulator
MTSEALKKSERTRAHLVDVAMRLFKEQGFDKTTMREIAGAAGLAQGAAYYYFDSKEHLIFEFYQRTYDEQMPEAERVLAKERGLEERLAGLVAAHLKAAQPYHAFSRVLFKSAADPGDPLSPFSEASGPLRQKNIELMGRVLEGQKVPDKLKAALPELLWLFKMLMILYWVHDKSPRQAKSFALVKRASGLMADALRLARIPGLSHLAGKLLDLYTEFKPF